MPEVIIIDEIGTEPEAHAARTIAERGVQLVGTAHGNILENLMLNPTLCDLIGGIQSVTLSDEEARRRGTQKSILERKAPPTFDVVIEIQSWDQVAVHVDVASTVDAILRGNAIRPQIRSVSADGKLKTEEQPQQITSLDHSTVIRGVVPATRLRRVYTYGASQNRLQQAAREMQLPVEITKDLTQADAVFTLKNYYRKKATPIRDAESSGIPVYVLKSNTVMQMEQALASIYDLDVQADPVTEALEEAEDAIQQVLARSRPVELMPQNSYVRRLQHQIAERYNLASRSFGRDPHRRVRISQDRCS